MCYNTVVASATQERMELSKWRKFLSFIALMPMLFFSIALMVLPAYAVSIEGLKWYSRLDYTHTQNIVPDFNIDNYEYCSISPSIDYYWGGGATECLPNSPEYFTNLWVGYITAPESGIIGFYSSNDDGLIVKINDQIVIDSWYEQGSWLYNSGGGFYMEEGVSYKIEVLHHETGGGAVAKLFWSRPSVNEIQIIPSKYFSTEKPAPPKPSIECWDGSLVFDQVDCPSIPLPTIEERQVSCSWINPYTKEEISGSATQRYYLYYDGTKENIDTVDEVCDAATPVFIEPDPLLLYRNVSCSWENPYTKDIVYGEARQQYYLFWNGTTQDLESKDLVCAQAAPVFVEPEPIVESRIVECIWTNPYTNQAVYGNVSQRYSIYWDGSEQPIDSLEVLCLEARPTFIKPIEPEKPKPSSSPLPEPSPENSPDPELPPSPKPEVPEDTPSILEVIESLQNGEAISAEQLADLGVDYSELPADTPVELENGVILTAEVADALELFENPSEILGAVFSDPSKALTAIANIGSDMTPEKRKESQKVVVAAVIAGQVLTTASIVGRVR